jgi:hypothetical protein
MTSKLTQWIEAHTAEHGAYAVLAGFEAALRAHNEVLDTWYGEADIDEQLALFGWVTDLLAEQAATEETMTSEVNDLRERVMAQLRPEGLIKPPAAEPPIAQALHRAVVTRVTAERDAAQKTVELRDGIIADHQATEAAIEALLDEGTRDGGIRLDGEYRRPLGQRVNLELQAEFQRGRAEGVTSGRAAVIVEAVELLGKDLERQSGPVRGTTVYCIEQLKGISPWAAP